MEGSSEKVKYEFRINERIGFNKKRVEHWGGEGFQAEATVGSKEFILYSSVCVCVYFYI